MPYIFNDYEGNYEFFPDEPSGFDPVDLAPGQGNLEQDYYVTDRGGVNTSYGGVFRPPPTASNNDWFSGLLNRLKTTGGKALNFAGSDRGIMAILAALAGVAGKRPPSGGGVGSRYQGPAQLTRTMAQGPYGPIARTRTAANGGLMQAYAQGGEAQAYVGGKPLMMEDGGFVFTEAATRKMGPQGIAALGGKRISAPGNGTDDKGITGIIGKHGVTPARVSNEESYFPKQAVEANGGPKRMHAKMKSLERKA